MRYGAMLAMLAMLALAGSAHAEDAARKACYPDAKRLCAAEVKAFNRKAAELCLWRQIDRTTPACHAAILKIHAERQAKGKGQ